MDYSTTPLNNTRMALRDGMPIGLGYLAISFAFGLIATAYDLTVAEAVLISAFNLTSAGQLASLPIISSAGSVIELALTQLIINLRYSLMSISLSQNLDKSITLPHRLYLSFTLTDEMFAVATSKHACLGRRYLLTLLLYPFLGWTLGTLLGAIAGNVLPSLLVKALGTSMYAMFIAILVPAAKDKKPVALCILISIVLSCLFEFLPILKRIHEGFIIIICALAVSLTMALLFPLQNEDAKEENV